MSKDNSQKLIEESMAKLHYESFNDWIENFAINLPNIWNESSAKKLSLNNDLEQKDHVAIVIGRGPSIDEKNHLQLLADSNFKGSIICCDGKLIDVLNAGITPDKFPNFYVITIDPYPLAKKFYDDEIIKKYGSKINGIFSTIVNPEVVEQARQSGIKIHWVHSLFDYNEGKKSFNQISALMVRAKNHKNGLPAIQTGGNVGTSAWFVAWKILKNNIVGLIGINHSWQETDSWEKIISHGRTAQENVYGKNISVEINQDSSEFDKLFKKIYNPEFDCSGIVDPLFQFYSEALKEFISRSPSWLSTINSTEGGVIFGNKIKCMKFQNFLDEHSL